MIFSIKSKVYCSSYQIAGQRFYLFQVQAAVMGSSLQPLEAPTTTTPDDHTPTRPESGSSPLSR